jgi:hypothetical protein
MIFWHFYLRYSHQHRLCTVIIPSVMISKADGSTLKLRLPVTISADDKGTPTCDSETHLSAVVIITSYNAIHPIHHQVLRS